MDHGRLPQVTRTPDCWKTLFAAAAILLAGTIVYARSFGCPFVLDDDASIANNLTIRELWSWPGPLRPPGGGTTVQGRPLLNLSFALNWAASGAHPWSYHAVNLAIHLAAGLTLFGIVRRSVKRQDVAAAVAILWVVHPLQTESVTYLAQRAESLMGLLYLLTLYFFIRGTEPEAESTHKRWLTLSWLACLLGTGVKEVIATAPAAVFLYDRTFVAGSFGEAWKRRKAYYAGLASTWLVVGILVAGSGSREGTVGVGSGVHEFSYLLTQFGALVHYLRLSLWPRPLVFDYGADWVRLADVLPQALALAALLAVVLGCLFAADPQSRKLGFAGAWFFIVLAPTSLVPSSRQTIAEHRMYLPLAGILVILALAADKALREAIRSPGLRRVVFAAAALIVAIAWGARTLRRNGDYATVVGLYADNVLYRPNNPYSHNAYGYALLQLGRYEDAIVQFREALRLKPDLADAHYNLAFALVRAGRLAEGASEYRETLRLKPGDERALCNLGIALASEGRFAEASTVLDEAVRLFPNLPEAQLDLGNALLALGRIREAIARYEAALQLRPDFPEARQNLAYARSLPTN